MRVSGDSRPPARSAQFWIERVVALGLVLAGAVILYGMTLPAWTGPWACRGLLGAVGVGAIFVGMPLLITGRVRQL